ncbi:MAG: orotidine-5'-phosphate decarboxylase [Anaerolineae bacterium]
MHNSEVMMVKGFVEKLNQTIEANGSLLCVGLDPDPARMPASFHRGESEDARLRAFCLNVIEQTQDLVCCYKPNFAFFEQAGPEGLTALKEVVDAIPAGIPVLLDAKRGDIGNTAKAYARAAFEVWGADAITVNPYLGRDGVVPFLAYEGKAVFLLCHTSNPSAAEIQLHGDIPLYEHIARQGQRWGTAAEVGFVVGATQVEALQRVRELAPDRWLLAPGIGAQGGDLAAALAASLDGRGRGVIVPVSRGVLYADSPREAALEIRARINRYRDGYDGELALALFEAGCIRFGEFTLASGRSSPIYVDLRRVISYPELFQRVVEAYSELLAPLSFDRLAAVPYAALPAAAAIALRLKRPMIYPRKEIKDYGTAQAVEGSFEPGQVAVAIEDVVTSGGSLLAAISTMEAAGLEIRDVVVLVDREQGGRARLDEAGYRLHAVLTLRSIVDALKEVGKIDAETHARVQAYLAS